jgi:hypothetical protein
MVDLGVCPRPESAIIHPYSVRSLLRELFDTCFAREAPLSRVYEGWG